MVAAEHLQQSRKWPLFAGIAFLALASSVEVVRILRLNGGTLVYTLDDAYIHLALADRIAGGHYGINANEFSSPASSILWPFLLAPLAHLPHAEVMPLLLNIAAAAGTVFVTWKILGSLLRLADPLLEASVVAALLVLLIFAGNAVGLVFTGMEHSLQVFLAVLLLQGMLRVLEMGRWTSGLVLAAIVGPLVRYENMALSAAAVFLLLRRGHPKPALGIAAALVTLVGGFSIFLMRLGLNPLPSSVLVKSRAVATAGSPTAVRWNLLDNLSSSQGVPLAAMLAVLLLVAVWSRREDGGRPLAGVVALAIGLQLLFGRNGWYNRYEVYVWVVALLAILWLGRRPLSTFLSGEPRVPRAFLFVSLAGLVVLTTCGRYLRALETTPLASNNIFGQQCQMHRFAVEYWRKPVAVNDLGCVSYRNQSYVLDFVGLATPVALGHLRSNTGWTWLEDLAREHEVELVMIYANLVPELPRQWIKLGELRLTGPLITPAFSTVTFFARSESAANELTRELRSFQRTLPAGTRFEFAGET